MKKSLLYLLVTSFTLISGQYLEPNCADKQVIVHLFEWSWNDIGEECETVLAPLGYCGVQVSPPMEHIMGEYWWTRYQPVSYNLTSRSGTREEFASMVSRCNSVGVNVIVDMVINHMSSHGGIGEGTAGTIYNGPNQNYPGVPYSYLDFHQPYCDIFNYNNAEQVRNCYLASLNDLDGSKIYVRQRIADYANDLIGLGVKGFRIDASKHMWPDDLAAMQRLWDNTVDGKQPFVFHEVIDHTGTEAVTMSEYFGVGKVTEFGASDYFTCLKGLIIDINCLILYPAGLIDGFHALTFVDNHDNQRGGGALTHEESYNYKLASGFHLAHEYGFKRVMSSYEFSDYDQGPPLTKPCGLGWACEHRWSSIGNLVQFTNRMAGEPVTNYQHKQNSVGFGRGSRGFFAMGELNAVLFDVDMPDGEYCDITHNCAQTITVTGGRAILSAYQANDPIVAFCIGCTAHDVNVMI